MYDGLPMDVIVEGMMTDPRSEGIAEPYVFNIKNIVEPITVRPSVRVTFVKFPQL